MIQAQITSIKHPKIIEARALSASSGRLERKKCQLCGESAIRWALKSRAKVEYALLHDQSDTSDLEDALQAYDVPSYSVSEGILKRVTGTPGLTHMESCL